MGHKKVCFNCRKAFNVSNDIEEKISMTCPNCGGMTSLLDHKFRPPKITEIEKWKVAEYLKNNGFLYQHVYKNYEIVPYPDNMKDAKEFVEAYKMQGYYNIK